MERPEFGVISTVDSRTKLQDGMSDSWHPAWLLDTGSWACLLQLEELSLDILTSPGKIPASLPQSEDHGQKVSIANIEIIRVLKRA